MYRSKYVAVARMTVIHEGVYSSAAATDIPLVQDAKLIQTGLGQCVVKH